jgi:hypothetical protein
VAGRLYPNPEPRERNAAAIATARRALGRGGLDGLGDPALVRTLSPLDVATFDLVFQAGAGDPDLTADDVAVAHAAWTATRTSGQAAAMIALRSATKACADSGVTVRSLGIVPSATYHATVPTPILAVTALGADAHTQTFRIPAPITDDITASLAKIIDRHVAAVPVAAEWAQFGAKGAVDQIAKRLMEFNGIALHLVVDALRGSRKVEFGGINGLRSGFFTWRDFAVSAEAITGMNCRISGNVVEVPKERRPDTTMDAASGRSLGDVAEQGFLPPTIVVEKIEARPNDDLMVTLRTSRILF